MITLNVEEHNDICGGCSYSGTANFDGKTVKEVLEEIREFAKDEGTYISEGFGNPSKHFASCWSIEINGVKYVGGQCGWKNEYKHQFDNWVVTKIKVSGGWYSFYDIHIECKEK